MSSSSSSSSNAVLLQLQMQSSSLLFVSVSGPNTPLHASASSSSYSSHPRCRPACSLSASAHTQTHANDADAELLSLLRDGHTDTAYRLVASNPSLPESPVSASRLLAQLSYRGPSSFSRAAALLHRLRARGALHLLDANSLSLAASAAARSNNPHLAYSLLLSMLRRGLLPDRRAYTAALARLQPSRALRLFDSVLHHLRRAPHRSHQNNSLPDTAALTPRSAPAPTPETASASATCSTRCPLGTRRPTRSPSTSSSRCARAPAARTSSRASSTGSSPSASPPAPPRSTPSSPPTSASATSPRPRGSCRPCAKDAPTSACSSGLSQPKQTKPSTRSSGCRALCWRTSSSRRRKRCRCFPRRTRPTLECTPR